MNREFWTLLRVLSVATSGSIIQNHYNQWAWLEKLGQQCQDSPMTSSISIIRESYSCEGPACALMLLFVFCFVSIDHAAALALLIRPGCWFDGTASS